MTWVAISDTFQQTLTVNGLPAVGYSLESYIYNTTTPTPMATNAAGSGQATSFTINSRGVPATSGGTEISIYLNTTQTSGYKFILKDGNGATVRTYAGPIFPAVSGAWSTTDIDGYADSMSDLVSGSWAGYSKVNVASFYGGWAATTAGPKGRSAWHHDGTTGGTPTTNSTAAIIAAMSTGRVISADGNGWLLSEQEITIDQFGAYGVESADSAIQSCVDYCAKIGNTAKAGPAIYKMNAAGVEFPENSGLVGAGYSEGPVISGAVPSSAYRTLIEYSGSAEAFRVRGTFSPWEPRRNIEIGGFRLLTRSSATTGISCEFLTRSYLHDLFLDGAPTYAQLEMLSCYNNTVERVYAKGSAQYGLYFDVNASDSVFSGQTIFAHCDFWDNDIGSYLGQAANIMAQVTFDTCHWQANRIGLDYAGGRQPVIINPHFENNTDYDLYAHGTNSPIILGGYCNSADNAITSIYMGGRDGSIRGMGFNQNETGEYIELAGDNNHVEGLNFRVVTGSTVKPIVVSGDNNTIGSNTYIKETSGSLNCVTIESTANRTKVARQNYDSSVTSGFISDSGTGTQYDGEVTLVTKLMALGGSADRNPFPSLGWVGYVKSVDVIYPTGTTAGAGCAVQVGRSTAPNSVDATRYLNVTSAVSAGTYDSDSHTASLASDKSFSATDVLTVNIAGGATATGDVVIMVKVVPFRVT